MFEKKPKVKAKVYLLPIEEISPSPHQPRKAFDQQELDSLARSIAQNGLLTPISVRRQDTGGYCLIAGERRLRACALLGMGEIPAIIETADSQSAAVLSFIENVHRQSLNCFEEAEGIYNLLLSTGYSQATVCSLIDMPQPTVANKLRLLRLTAPVRQALLQSGLGERIARALLRLPDEAAQLAAVAEIARQGFTAAQAEEYIARLGAPRQKNGGRRTKVILDYRLLFATVDKAVRDIRTTGVPVVTTRRVEDDCICYTIKIPRGEADSRQARA